jgi:hypothetical protein
MVLLTQTPTIVRAIAEALDIATDQLDKLQLDGKPDLNDAEVGKPITHSQLIDLSKILRNHSTKFAEKDNEDGSITYSLDSLLKGSQLYIPPPPPKKEPTPEFKALMERLRRDEEARAYERMVNPTPLPETFSQRFPITAQAHFDPRAADFEEDDLSYEEVHRQIVLIINVLVSIIACGVFIWVAARHWSVGKRLGLSMSGSLAIAIAEVVVYNGYVRKVKEAKTKEKKRPEIKKIVESWVIGKGDGKGTVAIGSEPNEKIDDGMRHRKGKHR